MRILIALFVLALIVPLAEAATLRVPSEHATIQAAIDAATDGDIVMVAPGEYTGAGNYDISLRSKLLTIKSESGPDLTTIDCQGLGRAFILRGELGNDPTIQGFTIKNGYHYRQGGAIECFGFSPTIRQCIFVDNVSGVGGGALYFNGTEGKDGEIIESLPMIEGCTFVGNSAQLGSVFYSNWGAYVTFFACLMVDNTSTTGSPTRYGNGGGSVTLDCCDLYGNTPGDWIDQIENQLGEQNNFSADPLFCDPERNTYGISTDSPCLASQNPCLIQIGAVGAEGCAGVYPVATVIIPGELSNHVIEHLPDFVWVYNNLNGPAQAGYQIEVGTDGDWNVAEMWSSGQVLATNTNQVYEGVPLVDGQTYYLRMRVFDGSNWGWWSELVFRMNTPATLPLVLYPEDQAELHYRAVILGVANAADAENDLITYDFEVASGPDMGNIVVSHYYVTEQLSETSVGPLTGLSDNSEYWWRVRSFDGYEYSAWSSPRSIQTSPVDILRVPGQFSTIQAAIDAALDGDVIEVDPGEYLEHLIFGTATISLISSGGRDATFITGTTHGEHLVQFPAEAGNNSLIEGFTIRGADRASGIAIFSGNSPAIRLCHLDDNSGLEGAGIQCHGDNVEIYGCLFTNNRCNDAKNEEGAGVWIVSDGVTIDSCIFAGNNAGDGSAGAIYTRFASNIIVSRNLAYDNSSVGQGTGFMYAYASSSITIVNNTIVYNTTNQRGAGITLINDNNVDIRNNIIAFNNGGSGIWVAFSSGVVAEYNDVYANDPDQYTGVSAGAGSISADPLFNQPMVDDYGLQQFSPCIDAGDPDPRYNDPDGSRSDMGANLSPVDYPMPFNVSITGEIYDRVVNHSPTFTWEYYDNLISSQVAYEFQIGIDPDWSVAEMWSTGEVWSADMAVTYGGLPLEDGVTYHTRLRLNNGTNWGTWATGVFGMNSKPFVPSLLWPTAPVQTLWSMTELRISNLTDPEGDQVQNTIEVYGDPELTELVVRYDDIPVETDGSVTVGPLPNLTLGEDYFWRVRAYDGLEYSEWSPVESFVTRGPTILMVPDQYANIQAAINSAFDDDIIEVSPGVYSGSGNINLDPRGLRITIRSAEGPGLTVIDCRGEGRAFVMSGTHGNNPVIEGFTLRNGFGDHQGGAVECFGLSPTFRQCVFQGNYADYGGALYINGRVNKEGVLISSRPLFEQCTFVGNTAGRGAVVYQNNAGYASFVSCLMVNNTSNAGTAPIGSSGQTLECCDLFGNVPGDWIAAIEDQATLRNNFSADPIFCDPSLETFGISPVSPCAPGNNSCGVQIGALGSADCGDYFPWARPIIGADDSLHVANHNPLIIWQFQAIDPNGQAAYEIEVGTDNDWSVAEMWSSGQVANSDSMATYAGAALEDGLFYHVRLRVSDGIEWSDWLGSIFRMNTAPTVPALEFPIAGAEMRWSQTELGFSNSTDPEDALLTYSIEIYDDPALTILVASYTDVPGEVGPTTVYGPVTGLSADEDYYWRVRASDGYEYSAWSQAESFVTVVLLILKVPEAYQTIQAAIDAAYDGDVVEVAPGVYSGPGNINLSPQGKYITIRSEQGAALTTIDCQGAGRAFILRGELGNNPTIEGFTIKNGYHNRQGGAIECFGFSPTIRQCIFVDNVAGVGGGAFYFNGTEGKDGEIIESLPMIEGCTFVGNNAELGSVFYSNWGAYVIFSACLMVDNTSTTGSPTRYGNGGGSVTLDCCDLYGNTPGDWIDQIENQLGELENFTADPIFCDPTGESFGILQTSPCAANNSPCGLQIGALGFEPCSDFFPAVELSLVGEIEDHVINHSPEFSWIYYDFESEVQTAYEIEVGTDNDWSVAELWSTGTVFTDELSVTYAGLPLLDGVIYYIRVRVSNASKWGPWTDFDFRMNTSPRSLVLDSPIDDEVTKFYSTYLEASANGDPEGDVVICTLEVFDDQALTELVYSTEVTLYIGSIITGSPVPGLTPDNDYFWRAKLFDGYEHSDWSEPESFVTDYGRLVRVPQDYPTIGAAVAAVGTADTVQVAQGTYGGAGNTNIFLPDHKGIVIISQLGPEYTIIDLSGIGRAFLLSGTALYQPVIDGFTFIGGNGGLEGGAIRCEGYSPTIRNCVFYDNVAIYGGALYFAGHLNAENEIEGLEPLIENCTFAGNTATSGGACFGYLGVTALLRNCLMIENWSSEGSPINMIDDASSAVVECSDLHGNVPGDWIGGIADQADVNGNFSLDPLFCNFHSGAEEFTVRMQSPCLPENNACGVLIGALGEGDNCEDYLCGDANGDEVYSWADLEFLWNCYFMLGPLPEAVYAADPNCDGMIALDDLTYLIAFLNGEGPAPCCTYGLAKSLDQRRPRPDWDTNDKNRPKDEIDQLNIGSSSAESK